MFFIALFIDVSFEPDTINMSHEIIKAAMNRIDTFKLVLGETRFKRNWIVVKQSLNTET